MLDRAHRMFFVFAILGLAGSAAACTKSEGTSSGTTSSASTTTAPPPSASAATAAPDAAPTAADTTTGTAPTAGTTNDAAVPATAAASGSAPPKASAGGANPELAAANAACGTKGVNPDCPLQAWMKANTNSAIASADLPALATALDKTATFAPPGYGNWTTIAKDGAKAAKAGDMTAAKASCRTCHDQYKTKYKAELRGRKI
jgi:hypothetical protein